MSGGGYYLLVMLSSILGNYLFAIWIDGAKIREKRAESKAAFALALIFNLGILFYFKYTNFFVGIIESIAKANFGLKEVVLPIGISFFTFQAMSYVIDVYCGKVKCQKNFLLISLYISFFPQLVAGPIVKYSDIEKQLTSRQESIEKFSAGIRKFLYGLAKKVIVSNVVGQVAETVFAWPVATLGVSLSWLGIICYTVQIYFDFSGYSDMAIGLGKMFGFDFCENFNYPYLATSVRNFWRRWHISLSSWFKEYVYIPLGGNRKGAFRTYVNLFVVFLLTGIWHGANYTFVLWGIFYGVFLVIERLFLGKLLDKNPVKILNWLYTMLAVVVLWVFFRAPDVKYAFVYISQMFSTHASVPLSSVVNLWQWLILAVGLLLCGPLQLLFTRLHKKVKEKTWFFWLDFATQIALLGLSVILLINDTFNPFIYFQF
ncbi:MAG: hypothetical protein NC099_05590 [Corallococcus sp.]|nr:hypothetical protein [Corallococcus sp.]